MQRILRIGSSLLVLLSVSLGLVAQQNPFDRKRQHKTPETRVKAAYETIIPDRNKVGALPQIALMPRPANLPTNLKEITYGPETGLPIHMRVAQAVPKFKQAPNDVQIAQVCDQFLDDMSAVMHIEGKEDFKLRTIERDDLGFTHVRLDQTYQGIPLHASDITLHFAPGEEMVFTGRYQARPTINDLTPQLDETAAIAVAETDLGAKTRIRPFGDAWKKMLDYENGPTAELVIFQTTDYLKRQRLAWKINIRPGLHQNWIYLVDAIDGSVLVKYDIVCTISPVTGSGRDLNGVTRQLDLFQNQGTYYMINTSEDMYTGGTTDVPGLESGIVITADLENDPSDNAALKYITSNDPNSWNATAVSAHFNGKSSYSYFKQVHNRNSINDNGGDVVSIINVPNEDGSSMENAFWDGRYMYYGNGASCFKPLAGSLDVGGHELTHGVVQETGNMEYLNQPGALNESFADIFGVLIDFRTTGVLDWALGETVMQPGCFPTGKLRDMANPNNGGTSINNPWWQPDHMDDLYTGTQDRGGVHINSGIPNHAFYRFVNKPGITMERAEQIYYRALSRYLTRSSQFIDCRLAVIQSAVDLGNNQTEINALRQAYDEVGILDPSSGGGGGQPPVDPEQDVDPNPGAPFIVAASASDYTGPEQWYVVQMPVNQNSVFTPISNTRPRGKMSIIDNGRLGAFVGEDHDIYLIDPGNPSNPQETPIDAPTYNSVALSKDGRLVAAVTDDEDGSIYIFDLGTNPARVRQFQLYNPTTSQGNQQAGQVLYADAITFDFCGEYVLYDALNQVIDGAGNIIQFWDIGFLRVWDLAQDDFGDGLISKLFTNIPEDISVGNARFAQNSPYVITFDFYDANTDESSVMTANIERNQVEVLWTQDVFGYPAYTPTDGEILFNSEDDSFNETIKLAELNNDKLTLSSTPFDNIIGARFATAFSLGDRGSTCLAGAPTSNEPSAVESQNGLHIQPNPASDYVQLQTTAPESGTAQWQVMDLMGRSLYSQAEHVHEGQALVHELRLDNWTAGTYLVRFSVGNAMMTKQVIVR